MMISYHSLKRLVSGNLLSRPKARLVIFTPGGACRRLYSLRSTNFAVFCTIALSNPSATIWSTDLSSSTYAVRIESRISYTGRLSESFLVGSQFGGWRLSIIAAGIRSNPACVLRYLVILLDQRLGNIFNYGETAGHIAVKRCITGGHFTLVAGGQYQPAEFIGKRHQ